MEAFIYLGKVSLYSIVFYGCFWVFLRKSTFFGCNRGYLLGALVLSFILPFLEYPSSAPVMSSAVYAVAVLPVTITPQTPEAQLSTLHWSEFALWVYLAGIFVMGMRLYRRIADLKAFMNQGDTVDMGHYKLTIMPLEVSDNLSSFSFFNRVVLNYIDYEHHLEEVGRHEMVHVRQLHSFDILFVEVVRALCWFNPVLLLYKSSLQEIHEYLADREASDRDEYAEFLISYSFGAPIAVLANHFFSSSLLKERIRMMYRERNSYWSLAKYLVVIPLIGTILMLTAARERILASIEAKKFISKEFYERGLEEGKAQVFGESMSTDNKGTLRGEVTDIDGNSLRGAHVVQNGRLEGTTTDKEGRFLLANLPLQSSVVVSFVGYESQEIKVRKENQVATVRLKPRLEGLEEVVVTGYRAKPDDSEIREEPEGPVFSVVEQNAEFPGGTGEMYNFLGANLTYPAEAAAKKVEGKVFLSFVVGESGEIRNPKILKGLGYGIDEEAIRVVMSMPRWSPGRQSGKAVAMTYNLPIQFTLDDASLQSIKAKKLQKDLEQTNRDENVSALLEQLNSVRRPLIIIDGLRQDGKNLKGQIEPNTIHSVTVFKGQQAMELYGPEGKNGVIKIITKK